MPAAEWSVELSTMENDMSTASYIRPLADVELSNRAAAILQSCSRQPGGSRLVRWLASTPDLPLGATTQDAAQALGMQHLL